MSGGLKLVAYFSGAAATALLGAASLVPSSALAACVALGASETTRTKCVPAITIPGNPLTRFAVSWVYPNRPEYDLSDRSHFGIDII
jgi:hypothetical protein